MNPRRGQIVIGMNTYGSGLLEWGRLIFGPELPPPTLFWLRPFYCVLGVAGAGCRQSPPLLSWRRLGEHMFSRFARLVLEVLCYWKCNCRLGLLINLSPQHCCHGTCASPSTPGVASSKLEMCIPLPSRTFELAFRQLVYQNPGLLWNGR